MTMTDERLAELDAVMAKATARDWYTGDDAAHPANVRIRSNYRSHIAKVYAADMDDHDQAERDATAVVALHNAYPDLRAHIDAQAATIARLREAAKRIADHPNFYITACECGEPECATTQFIAAIAEAEGAQ